MGINSAGLVDLSAKMSAELDVEISVTQLFETSNLKTLAEHVSAQTSS